MKKVKIFKIKKPLYKNWWFWLLVGIILAFLLFGVPIIINESYKLNGSYITMWTAADVLSYYAVVLTGFIAVITLVTTLDSTKKDTDKKLSFYMSQVNTPFFIIDNVFQVSIIPFNKDEQGVWRKTVKICDDWDEIIEEFNNIEITLLNIGQGIALEFEYKADTLTGENIITNPFAKKDETITLVYDFEKSIKEKLANLKLKNKSPRKQELYHTSIKLKYKNTMGVLFSQNIQIEVVADFDNEIINISISPASFQMI